MCSRERPNPKKQLAEAVKAAKASKPAKYRNKKTVVDGITFDSKREAERWLQLRALQASGAIFELRRQVRYEYMLVALKSSISLPDSIDDIPRVQAGRVRSYVADFVYWTDDGMVVEDVKPETKPGKKPYRTKEYKAKKKIVEALYGIKITEV